MRNQSNVTRSRNDCEHDKHFSVKRHSSEILVASATGTRREDLCKITIKDFEEHNNHLYVRINGSKSGRNRLVPVLKAQEQVLKQYPKRHEYRTITNKQTGEKEVHEIKSEYYSPHGEDKKYLRGDVYIVSQALGHNRIDVTHSYIK